MVNIRKGGKVMISLENINEFCEKKIDIVILNSYTTQIYI